MVKPFTVILLFIIGLLLMPARTSLQDVRRDISEEGWTKTLANGVPILIAKQRVNYVERSITLYIPPQEFTPDKLRRVFTGLAAEFSTPHDLWMFAYSDKERLKEAFARKPPSDSVHFSRSPEGRRAERRQNRYLYGLRSKQRGLRAMYFRLDVRESYTYETDPEKGIEVTVDLKHPDPDYSGHPTPDLFTAIEYKDLTKTQEVIAAGADVNARGKDGTPPLTMAVLRGEYEIASALLKAGAMANYKQRGDDGDGETALMWAALNGDADMIHLLLDAGADINAHDDESRDSDAETALIKAAQGGYFKAVQALVSGGAKVDDRNCIGETALMVAAEAGSAETVQYLLDSGADVNARDKYGMTALMLAFDDKETVETLLGNGADYKVRDKEGMTALLHSITTSNDPAKRDALIENGAGADSVEAAKVLMTSAPDMEWMPRDSGKQEGYRLLSMLYLKLGMKQEAVETSKQALQVFGDQADLRHQLGLTYLAVGEKASAKEQYEILRLRAAQAESVDAKRDYQLCADALWRELSQ